MGWDDVETSWGDSNDKYKVSSTSKERVEYTGNNLGVGDRHTDRHAGNVDHGHTCGHVYTCLLSDVRI